MFIQLKVLQTESPRCDSLPNCLASGEGLVADTRTGRGNHTRKQECLAPLKQLNLMHEQSLVLNTSATSEDKSSVTQGHGHTGDPASSIQGHSNHIDVQLSMVKVLSLVLFYHSNNNYRFSFFNKYIQKYRLLNVRWLMLMYKIKGQLYFCCVYIILSSLVIKISF